MINSYKMILDCYVRLVALSPQNSFNRPVQSNIYLGIRRSHIQEPRLVLVTRSSVIEFKLINNVRRIYQKELNSGKIGIEFKAPPHQLLINATNEDLVRFSDLLSKLTNKSTVEKMDYIPVIPPLNKPKLRTNPKNDKSAISAATNQVLNRKSISTSVLKNPTIRFDSNLKVLDLPNSNITKLPIKLGRINVQTINLEGNAINDDNLQWLEETSIMKSLEILNLAGNKIKSFPSVLIDYSSLFSLNLRDNSITYLPGSIGQLKTLRFLNLSGNNLKFLPASITTLNLEEVDLTYNCLTNNSMVNSCDVTRNNELSSLLLKDIAAKEICTLSRRSLTYKDCPRRLLDRLRCSSMCICGEKSIPLKPAQYYKALIRIKFAITYRIHPQKGDFNEAPMHSMQRKGDGSGNIFLQYHFCSFTDHCPKVKTENYESSYCCYRLLNI